MCCVSDCLRRSLVLLSLVSPLTTMTTTTDADATHFKLLHFLKENARFYSPPTSQTTDHSPSPSDVGETMLAQMNGPDYQCWRPDTLHRDHTLVDRLLNILDNDSIWREKMIPKNRRAMFEAKFTPHVENDNNELLPDWSANTTEPEVRKLR